MSVVSLITCAEIVSPESDGLRMWGLWEAIKLVVTVLTMVLVTLSNGPLTFFTM